MKKPFARSASPICLRHLPSPKEREEPAGLFKSSRYSHAKNIFARSGCMLLCLCMMLSASAQTCIERTYTSQIGVRELTNHNDGREVEMYLHTCGLGRGYAWCAAFVKWSYMQCGIDTRRITAWAATCINWSHIIYRDQHFTTEPRAGDNITFWDYAHQRVAHTGLYHRRVNDTFYESVEGNTNEGGSAEGDGVYRKKRSFRATYVISRWE